MTGQFSDIKDGFQIRLELFLGPEEKGYFACTPLYLAQPLSEPSAPVAAAKYMHTIYIYVRGRTSNAT